MLMKKNLKKINVDNNVKKKPNVIVLSMPLVVSFIALSLVITTPSGAVSGGMLLSPPGINMTLLMGIIIFIAGYVTFLMFLFSQNIKEFFRHDSKN